MNFTSGTIWTCDHLPIMRGMNSESVGLTYLVLENKTANLKGKSMKYRRKLNPAVGLKGATLAKALLRPRMIGRLN